MSKNVNEKEAFSPAHTFSPDVFLSSSGEMWCDVVWCEECSFSFLNYQENLGCNVTVEKVLPTNTCVSHTRRINVESRNKTFEFRDIVITISDFGAKWWDMPPSCVYAYVLVLMCRNFIEWKCQKHFAGAINHSTQHTRIILSVASFALFFIESFALAHSVWNIYREQIQRERGGGWCTKKKSSYGSEITSKAATHLSCEIVQILIISRWH